MPDKIEPCPFCKGKAKYWRIYLSEGYVGCTDKKCLAYGPNGDTRAEAIRKWNAAPRQTDTEAQGGEK